MDYNKTINLPKTDFPMRGGLPAREPDMLKRWEDMDLYHELLKKNEGKPSLGCLYWFCVVSKVTETLVWHV